MTERVLDRQVARQLALWPVERIAFGLPSRSKQEVIAALLDLVAMPLALTNDARARVVEMVLGREKSGSTAAGQLAIPHAKSPDVTDSVGALGVFPAGVDFQAIDGERVCAVFLLVSPADRAGEHLENLRWIASIARAPDFMRFLRRARTPADARSLLEEMAGQ